MHNQSLLALVTSLLFVTGNSNAQTKLVTGTIHRIDLSDSELSIDPITNDPNAGRINVKIDKTTKITVDGQAGTIKSLSPKDKVALAYDTRSSVATTVQVTSNASIVRAAEKIQQEKEAKEKEAAQKIQQEKEAKEKEEAERLAKLAAEREKEEIAAKKQLLEREASIKENERLAAIQIEKDRIQAENDRTQAAMRAKRDELDRIERQHAAKLKEAQGQLDKDRKRDAERASERASSERWEKERSAEADQALVVTALLVFVVIAALVAYFISLVWIVRDSKNRSVDNGVFWLIATLFFGFIVWWVYLFSRPQGALTLCRNCRNKKLPYVLMCPHCGFKTTPKHEDADDEN